MQFSRIREQKAIRRQTAGLLEGLGSTGTDVATSLGGYQVRGRPRDANGCAVAVYLQAVLGADPRIKAVRVSETSVRITLLRRSRRVQVPSPPPVRAFIESFDHGLFPSLVRPAVAEGGPVDVPTPRESEPTVPTST